MARTAKLIFRNLTSIYNVRYFEGDVPDKEKKDPTIHKDAPFESN